MIILAASSESGASGELHTLPCSGNSTRPLAVPLIHREGHDHPAVAVVYLGLDGEAYALGFNVDGPRCLFIALLIALQCIARGETGMAARIRGSGRGWPGGRSRSEGTCRSVAAWFCGTRRGRKRRRDSI